MGRTYTDAKARIAELEKAEEVMSTNNESLMKRCENYMDAKAEIERLTALVPKWVSVEETPHPNHDRYVHCYDGDEVFVGFYNHLTAEYISPCWCDKDGNEVDFEITHWMPLPPAPEASDASPNS